MARGRTTFAIWRRYITPDDRDQLMRVVRGALKETVRAHGPIASPGDLDSAAKRVVGQLMTHVKNMERDDQPLREGAA